MDNFCYFLESECGATSVRDLSFAACKKLLKDKLEKQGLLFALNPITKLLKVIDIDIHKIDYYENCTGLPNYYQHCNWVQFIGCGLNSVFLCGGMEETTYKVMNNWYTLDLSSCAALRKEDMIQARKGHGC